MFTGIIETQGVLKALHKEGQNLRLTVGTHFSNELKIDQSLAHNGVCLTVTRVDGDQYEVIAVRETLEKSNLGRLKKGDAVNLERCVPLNGRMDGHVVQGHVDTIARVLSLKEQEGSWEFTFHLAHPTPLIVEKGSITLNGVSLTVFQIEDNKFSVAIIPYTYEHTNFSTLIVGDEVNVEFDIFGKYVARIMEERS
jgi:riboflavin synthase